MKNNILIGSIIASMLLILVSFSPVLGYNNINSNLIKESPLFRIRINREVEKESKDLNCDFLGKGIETKIHLPTRTFKSELFEKFIKSIKNMNDKSFDRFIDLIIEHVYNKGNIQGYKMEEIILSLYKLKLNPSEVKLENIESKQMKLTTESPPTECIGSCFTRSPNPVSCLATIIFILLFILISIIDFINSHF